AAKAEEIVGKLKSGQAIEELAKANNAELKRANDVKRAPRPDLPNAVIAKFFEVGPRGAGSAQTEAGRLIFFVRDATTPAFDPTSIESKTIAEQLKP
ncbi:MAG: peptidylprolyl isomerase, partial [Methylocystis sp.]|nr:peptidylprolyl isomerase [Methylocystis sp.]